MESVIQSGEELLNRLIKLKEDDDLSRIGKLFRIISGNPRQFNYRDESANCAYLHS